MSLMSDRFTLDDLQRMLKSGAFHHATYRDHGTVWEGLYIYQKDDNGFNGFTIAGSFPKKDPDLRAAEDMVRHTGVSVGAYGEG